MNVVVVYSESSKHDGFSKPLTVILFIVIALVILTPIVYFISLRPTDNDIEAALQNVSVLQKNQTIAIPVAFETISKPGTITPEFASWFKSRIDSYNNSVRALEESPAIQRSASTKSVYDTYKSEVKSYGESLAMLSKSVSAYGDILTECSNLAVDTENITSKAEFDKLSAKCIKVISDTNTSSDKAFNEQFLNTYRVKLRSVISAVGQYFIALENKKSGEIIIARNTIKTTYGELAEATPTSVTLDYSAPGDDTYSKLMTALESQKNTFIR